MWIPGWGPRALLVVELAFADGALPIQAASAQTSARAA